MDITDRVANEYRRRLAQVMEASKRDLPNIKYDAQDAQQLGVAVIYATIIEIAEDCAVLLHRERSTSVPAILRSLIESYADLCSVLPPVGHFPRRTGTSHDLGVFDDQCSWLEFAPNPSLLEFYPGVGNGLWVSGGPCSHRNPRLTSCFHAILIGHGLAMPPKRPPKSYGCVWTSSDNRLTADRSWSHQRSVY
jgi:hypothetical protein